jgi:hypothetical protein
MQGMENNILITRHLRCYLQVGCRVLQEENDMVNKYKQIHNVGERGLLLNKRVTKLWMNETRKTPLLPTKTEGKM